MGFVKQFLKKQEKMINVKDDVKSIKDTTNTSVKFKIGDKIKPIVVFSKGLCLSNKDCEKVFKEGDYGVIRYLGEYNMRNYANVFFPRYGCELAYYITDIKPCSEVEALQQDEAIKLERNKQLQKFCTKHTPYTKRKILELNKMQALNTSYNFIAEGTWNTETDQFTISNRHWAPTCCALTKCTRDLMVYIPQIWLQYYGYSVLDIERWLKFLTGCDIGCHYKYLGLGEYDGDFRTIMSVSQSPASVVPENSFHKIAIKYNGGGSGRNYMHFILIRYLYNSSYWNIPATALQLKFYLKNKVTNFEALLLAHMRQAYNGYYNICANNSTNFADPFQDIKALLQRISSNNYSMNNSLEYITSGLNQTQLTQFFEKRDYEGLLEYVTSKKKKKI